MKRALAGLLQSTPQTPVPLAPLLTGIAVLWAAPLLSGLFLMALVKLLATALPAEVQLQTYVIAMALFFSPFFSWTGWLLALPLGWVLLRSGWFGWLPAAAAGLVSGSVAGSLTDSAVAPLFGLIALLLLRLLLGRSLPLSPA